MVRRSVGKRQKTKRSRSKQNDRSRKMVLVFLLLIMGLLIISYIGSAIGSTQTERVSSIEEGSDSGSEGLDLFSELLNPGCIAYIHIKGELVSDDTYSLDGEYHPGSRTLARKIDELRKDDHVRGLLLEIDSQGGTVIATKELYRALEKFSREKPYVVYIHEIGTSGGYYIALPADRIIVNPDAMTGNIGVRATFISMEGLLDKLGITPTTIKSGEFKDMGDPFHNMTDEEKEILQGMLMETYEEFVNDLTSHRDLSEEELSIITDGRIFSGRQAVGYGLADETGYYEDALNAAENLTGVKRVCRIDIESKGPFSQFFSEFAYYFGRGLGDSISLAKTGVSKIMIKYE